MTATSWRRPLRLVILGAAAVVGLLATSQPAAAHPMGNFSINHFASLVVTPHAVRVLYVVDIAEIPTFQDLSSINADPSGRLRPAVRGRYLTRRAHELAAGLRISFEGKPIRMRLLADDLLFPPGAGGLATERLYLVLQGKLPAQAGAVRYVDTNFAGRAGWKEIVVRSVDRPVHSALPRVSRSGALTEYPISVVSSPPQDTNATLVAGASEARAGGALGPAGAAIQQAEAPLLGANGSWSDLARGLTRVGTRTAAGIAYSGSSPGRIDALTNLIKRDNLPAGVLLLSIVVAFWFGAGHALSPGHGKTIVAAYLIGSRGTAWHAVFLGIVVTATHTAGVFALGLVTLYLSGYILPDQLYPWLGFTSGMLVAAMGAVLFVRRLRASISRRRPTESASRRELLNSRSPVPALAGGTLRLATAGAHAPASRLRFNPTEAGEIQWTIEHLRPEHRPPAPGSRRPRTPDSDRKHSSQKRADATHRHGLFGREHSHAPVAREDGKVSLKSLLALGISGGLLPCPSALVVLLSAIAFHRVAFGILLIVFFSLGLASTLTGVGLLVLYARRFIARLQNRTPSVAAALSGAARILPLVSASCVAAIGAVIALGAVNPAVFPALII